MRALKFVAVIVGFTLAGAAHAQGAPGGAAPNPNRPTIEMRGPDERMTDYNRLNDEVTRRKAGRTRSLEPIPAHPDDVTPGSEVRDSRGVVIAKVDSVGLTYAVVANARGKIEVEFESFAKNNRGLLINMPKAKFDAIIAGSAKPAN